jgi:hypothetical protein
MKLVINVPDYVKEQADDGKGEELGIPLWLAYEIANGTPLMEKTDAISRAEVLDLIDSKDPNYEVRHFKEDVECLPPVTPQPKTGRWICWYEVIESADGKSTDHIPHCKCSECGFEYDTYSSRFIKYCPNCGARMVVDEPVDKTNESVDELKND